jgi:hypothetical protein
VPGRMSRMGRERLGWDRGEREKKKADREMRQGGYRYNLPPTNYQRPDGAPSRFLFVCRYFLAPFLPVSLSCKRVCGRTPKGGQGIENKTKEQRAEKKPKKKKKKGGKNASGERSMYSLCCYLLLLRAFSTTLQASGTCEMWILEFEWNSAVSAAVIFAHALCE